MNNEREEDKKKVKKIKETHKTSTKLFNFPAEF
jgi:hypothetical protein